MKPTCLKKKRKNKLDTEFHDIYQAENNLRKKRPPIKQHYVTNKKQLTNKTILIVKSTTNLTDK